MSHKQGHIVAGRQSRGSVEWLRHPNVIGPVPLSLVEGNRSLIVREDIDDDFTKRPVTGPALDVVH